jgi:hypothetical protein
LLRQPVVKFRIMHRLILQPRITRLPLKIIGSKIIYRRLIIRLHLTMSMTLIRAPLFPNLEQLQTRLLLQFQLADLL